MAKRLTGNKALKIKPETEAAEINTITKKAGSLRRTL